MTHNDDGQLSIFVPGIPYFDVTRNKNGMPLNINDRQAVTWKRRFKVNRSYSTVANSLVILLANSSIENVS